jgi:hypothetical protein
MSPAFPSSIASAITVPMAPQPINPAAIIVSLSQLMSCGIFRNPDFFILEEYASVA